MTDYGSVDKVLRVDPDTGERTVLSTNASPSTDGIAFASLDGLHVDARDGTIYVADSNAYDGGGGVFRVDPVSGERTMISNNDSPAVGSVPDYENPGAIAIDRNGDLLVADRMSQNEYFGSVIRVDPQTGARTLVSANDAPDQDDAVDLVSPAGIAVAPDDSILVSRDPFSRTTSTASSASTPPRASAACSRRPSSKAARTRAARGASPSTRRPPSRRRSSPGTCRRPGPRGYG